jgi:hypothetical protein
MVDNINHPEHYVPEDNTYEVIKVIEAWGFDKDHYLGNVLRYCYRAGKKSQGTEIEDLRKAIWYLNRKIDRLKNERNQRT